MKNSDISNRLLQYIQHIGMSLASFTYNCGINPTSVLNGQLTNKAINKILSAYPELNPQWLKYGDGIMLGKPIEKSATPIPTPQNLKDKRKPKRKSKAILVSNTITENEPLAKTERKPHRGKMPRPIRDRLRRYMASLKLSSSEFAKTIGVLESRVSKIDETPDALLPIIYRKYPAINPQWLEDGIGNMLLDTNEICIVRGDKRRAEEWKTGAQGYKWALEKVLEGIPRKEIIREFNRRHEQDPYNYSTRTGKPLSDGILSIWIKNSGLTPPVTERLHPYRKNITGSHEVNGLLPQMTVQDILLSMKRQSSLHSILASIIAYKNKQSNVVSSFLHEPVISYEDKQPQTEAAQSDTEMAICISVSIEKPTARQFKSSKPSGFNWVIKRAKEGASRGDIIREFNAKHLADPEHFSTRKGKPLNDEILNIWLKRVGISLPSENLIGADVLKEQDNQSISLVADTGHKPVKKRKSFNLNILKSIHIAIGAIGGIFLLVWIIAEFIFPAIFIGLLFLAMLFAKK